MKHNFTYFFSEGVGNMFSHGFMSFAAIGITVACLVVMGTFSLVAYNAEVQLETLESEYEILAFVDETCDDARTQQVGRALSKIANVKDVEFITKEQATESCEKKYAARTAYSLRDLKSREDWNEWQANVLGAAILMPQKEIDLAMWYFAAGRTLINYEGRFSYKDRFSLSLLCQQLGVSKAAAVIRLRHLG